MMNLNSKFSIRSVFRASIILLAFALFMPDTTSWAAEKGDGSGKKAKDLSELRKQRKEASHRRRRIIFNNDGGDLWPFIIKAKKMTPDEWKDVIDTNLTGAFNVCKTAAEKIGDGGRIVNVSSIAAFHGFFGQCNYAAAKGGIASLTKVLCRELAKRKITVNAVAPGVVLTEMGKAIPEAVRQEMLKSIPLGRFGEPEEIANVILFLCSDLATYVTGQTIHVSGGWWV